MNLLLERPQARPLASARPTARPVHRRRHGARARRANPMSSLVALPAAAFAWLGTALELSDQAKLREDFMAAELLKR